MMFVLWFCVNCDCLQVHINVVFEFVSVLIVYCSVLCMCRVVSLLLCGRVIVLCGLPMFVFLFVCCLCLSRGCGVS